jgi:tRNA modification GTPase
MTIYALSTAPGRAGIAVVRISGKAAGETLRTLCAGKVPAPRFAALRALRHPASGEVLDRALVLWFPGPASFTAEDMAELHLHGGRAVIAGVLDALARLGLRMAEPGEFTKRAFENGKLDLTEAEGLADLINAETAAQRVQALAQSGGQLRARYEAWRSTLLRSMAYVEASLDFSDEGEIAEEAFNAAVPEVRSLADELDRALANDRRGEIVREGVQVAITGAPNVGKSSLLNALAGREAAIVFDEPGTTRDIIEVVLDLDGFPFVVRDTAGLRDTASPIEEEGIRRALAAAADADIVLLLEDASAQRLPHPRPSPAGGEGETASPRLVLTVASKIDLAPRERSQAAARVIPVSAKTGEGLEALKGALVAFARENYGGRETPLITRARHRQEIGRARSALAAFLACAGGGDHPELAAEHLRDAADALARLTGRLDVEDVLGQIFSEFCIGK